MFSVDGQLSFNARVKKNNLEQNGEDTVLSTLTVEEPVRQNTL